MESNERGMNSAMVHVDECAYIPEDEATVELTPGEFKVTFDNAPMSESELKAMMESISIAQGPQERFGYVPKRTSGQSDKQLKKKKAKAKSAKKSRNKNRGK